MYIYIYILMCCQNTDFTQEGDFAQIESIEALCPFALPGSSEWTGDDSGFDAKEKPLTPMEYHAYVCKNFRNSIIKFNNKEWATMTKVQREEIFEHYSVVVRADSGSTCTFTWDSQEIHYFYDFYVERQAHGMFSSCHCLFFLKYFNILCRNDETVVDFV